MGTEKFNIVMQQYLEEFEISKQQRLKLFTEDLVAKKPLPVKYQKALREGKAEWRIVKGSKKALYLLDEQNWAIANPRVAGKPKIMKINSQVFWSGGASAEWIRTKVKTALSMYFTPYICRQLPDLLYAPKDKFIQIEYIFYYHFNPNVSINTYQDYINHFFVRAKVFEDTLVQLKIIPDDNPNIIRGGYGRYVHIDNPDERRLEVKIHFCGNNERIS